MRMLARIVVVALAVVGAIDLTVDYRSMRGIVRDVERQRGVHRAHGAVLSQGDERADDGAW